MTGDTIPNAVVHMTRPDRAFAFDADPAAAAASRRMVLGRAAAEKRLVIGYHWPELVGLVETQGGAFGSVPV